MSDSGRDASPRLYRISTLKDFLPLSEEASISTRGQKLPALIASRSTTNVHGLRKDARRRRSSLGSEDLPRFSGENERPNSDLSPEAQRRMSSVAGWGGGREADDRRMSLAASILATPQMRSQRLIGNSNPRYRWEQYYKTDEELSKMKKPIRQYYERNNFLIKRYIYIDRLLDSSLPHNLIQEYQHQNPATVSSFDPSDVPATITEEPTPTDPPALNGQRESSSEANLNGNGTTHKVKRTPKDVYRYKESDDSEFTPLLRKTTKGDEEQVMPPEEEEEEEVTSSSRIVTLAIRINMLANFVLLVMKCVVAALTNSVSVLASLVDAALDFLSTAIMWVSTYLIENSDQYGYPIGRRRLEPVGVLVFSVIMITAFFQVMLEGVQKLGGTDHTVVQLTIPAIVIMAATVVIKFVCWFWCRLVKNSSVQALAQDAMTDVVFNTFSIIFPLIGFYAHVWWLDPLGGVLLSLYVISNWAGTSSTHIRNLTGCAATADERNVLLYLTMRFAKTIKQIQGLQAYHSGDKLNVEVDVVLDEGTSLRDSHDLGESLQYVLESVPAVDRAFVHLDYAGYNLPSHMQQDS
ncbi:hypothetical protein LTR85_011172 [Meristemomyces frigidus]|nr:hypothetical protein LTR85_011172 [Meristemomyces frigidus]